MESTSIMRRKHYKFPSTPRLDGITKALKDNAVYHLDLGLKRNKMIDIKLATWYLGIIVAEYLNKVFYSNDPAKYYKPYKETIK